jgi:hypothetical protein
MGKLLRGALTVLVAALAVSCAGGSRDAVTAALDAFALAVNPAQDFALDACIATEQAIAAEAEAGKISVVQARERLGPVRRHCDRAALAFETLRRVHTRAAERVEAGDIESARALVAELRSQWAGLQHQQHDGGVP